MEFIGTIFNQIIKDGQFTTESLLMIVAAILLYGYIKVLKPMKAKIDVVPTLEELNHLSDAFHKAEDHFLEALIEKLNTIINDVDEVGDINGNVYREVINLKRDLEQVKQILNQFQGHMMYGSSKSSEFGNRELK